MRMSAARRFRIIIQGDFPSHNAKVFLHGAAVEKKIPQVGRTLADQIAPCNLVVEPVSFALPDQFHPLHHLQETVKAVLSAPG